ncbi:MAG TPA: signal recognition particle-docking protein FtsY [Rickettsiales bacterium]|nr:signal recognition particle-docking protein FtsY [Rickettsiales bacterium]
MSIFKSSNIENKLDKTATKISTGLFSIFTGKKIDDSLLEELEELLITSDLGINITNKILSEIKKNKYTKTVDSNDIKNIISKYLLEFLHASEKKLDINPNRKPHIIMFVGVNGVGKTTVIGKIAKKLKLEGKKVLISACDTFRAGAVEQLEKWSKDSNVDMVQAEKEGTDPSAVAYKALEKAKKENYDVLLIDTAGRMQNNINLMHELEKIDRVIKKLDEKGVDDVILVLDATVGQNTKKQVELFNKTINISGLIMNKMDGTAKGGILVSIVNEFKKPIYAIGIGEGIDDLQEFNKENFVNSLLKIEE